MLTLHQRNALTLAEVAARARDENAAGVRCPKCGCPMAFASLEQVEVPSRGVMAAAVSCTARGCAERGLLYLA